MALLSHFPAIDEVEGDGREDCANRDLLAGLCRKPQDCRRGLRRARDDPEMITELAALVVSTDLPPSERGITGRDLREPFLHHRRDERAVAREHAAARDRTAARARRHVL